MNKLESSIAHTVFYRDEYTEENYNSVRPNAYRNSNDISADIQTSMRAYKEIGIIRNIIDLMSDFVCKGIKITHPVAKQERIYREWFNYVHGYDVSERFVNYLYRMGQVIVNSTYGTVTAETESEWNSTYAEISIEIPSYSNRKIPLKYVFLNPLNLEIIAPDIVGFTSEPFYSYRINRNLFGQLETIKSRFPSYNTDDILSRVPANYIKALKNGESFVPLPSNLISIYYYRKDDWCYWAEPMLSCVFEDLELLRKMKMADKAIMDSAINKVRLWKLGKIIESNLSQSIIPPPEIFNKFRQIMNNNAGGGNLDIFWTPDVELLETKEDYSGLGIDKYIPVYTAIYDGLGIPFNSNAGSSSRSMNSDFIKMQTFVERLEYARRKLTEFWQLEIKKVQKALGFASPALITFDQINLGDDNSYKQILLELYDRDIISIDSLLDNFKMFSRVEQVKIKREAKQRKSNKLPPKAGKFHSPQTEHELRKIILQAGGVTPSEVGLELMPKESGQVALFDKKIKATRQQAKDKGGNNTENPLKGEFEAKNNVGRPSGAKDKVQRKMKSIPTSKAGFVNTFLWASEAQQKISEIVTPHMLETVYNKKDARNLTKDEFEEIESIKFILLSHLQPFEEVTAEKIAELNNPVPNADITYMTKALKAVFIEKNKREPLAEEQRQIQSSAYALVLEQENEELKFFSDKNPLI